MLNNKKLIFFKRGYKEMENQYDYPLIESLLNQDLVQEMLVEDNDLIVEAESAIFDAIAGIKSYILENLDLFIMDSINIDDVKENIVEFVSSFTCSLLEHTADMFIEE
jgi:hypothetical protein